MPRLVFALGLALLASAAGAQDRYALGARVGDTLDAEERAYFGLFPRLDAPPPYRFVADGDSVRVVQGDAPLLALPREHADRLGRLVDSFEDYPHVSANPAWEASAAFVRYVDARTAIPRPSVARQVRASTADGSYVGFVLYTTDSLLVMAPDVAPRDPALPGAYVLPREAVVALDRTVSHRWQRWGPALGAAAGAVVGGVIASPDDRVPWASFGSLLGHTAGDVASRLSGPGLAAAGAVSLDEVTFFDGPRPPELPGREAALSLVRRLPPTPLPRPRRPRRYEWVSVGVQGVVTATEPDLALVGTTVSASVAPLQYARTTLAPHRDDRTVPFRVDVSARPIPWVRLGAYLGRSTTGSDASTESGTEQILRTLGTVRPYAEAVLPVLRVGRQRLEVAAGGGLESYRLRSLQIAPAFVQQGRYQRPVTPATLDVEASGTAWFYHVGVELYASPSSSLFVRHGWHPLPDLDVEAFGNLYALNPDILLRLVDEHTVAFSYRELAIGSRFHF